MENFHIRPLSGEDIDAVFRAAGGVRAHPDADRRGQPSADYLLSEALVELKALDDEGLAKPERQAKLAALFREHKPSRPVVVLDRADLPAQAQWEYDHILEGPIKTAVGKARKQLKQSRIEHPSASTSVLFVINNGYTALDHKALVRMVAHRARNDTAEIDGIVVAGCYFYSDTVDSYFIWPIDYVPINLTRPFASYEKLRTAWSEFADTFMTNVVRGEISPHSVKGPVVDTQFELEGVTYVKPAPPIGKESAFFGMARPRKDSSGLTRCPPVAITFPDMTHEEWRRFRDALPGDPSLFADYERWQAERAAAAASGTALRPFVPVSITYDEWEAWSRNEQTTNNRGSVVRYANELVEQRLRMIIDSARERLPTSILPLRYILVVTEEIGQDRANDLSHIAVVSELPHSDPVVRELVADARMFHLHAIAVASAYAVAAGIESVMWQKNLTYAWV